MKNPDLHDLVYEDSGSVSNAPVVLTIIDNLLPNGQLYEICSQVNEG